MPILQGADVAGSVLEATIFMPSRLTVAVCTFWLNTAWMVGTWVVSSIVTVT